MLPFIIGSSAGILLAGETPAFAFYLLGADCDWLVIVKLRMLFAPAPLSSVFTLLIAPVERPIGFGFLFFNASGAFLFT
jgi:hypothetical protein